MVDFTTLFPYKSLPKVHGKPTYKSIKDMKDKLCANAAKITSDLGEGGHSHLGLVLTVTEYANVSATAYTYLAHPISLNIPAGTTNIVAATLREQHKKSYSDIS